MSDQATDHDTLRAKALAATPGPWVECVLGSEGYEVRTAERVRLHSSQLRRRIRVARLGYEAWEVDRANAEYIAAVNPTAVLALLADLDRHREAVANVRAASRRCVERVTELDALGYPQVLPPLINAYSDGMRAIDAALAPLDKDGA